MKPLSPRVDVPQMCEKHQRLLVTQAEHGPRDPWRALILMAQVALFQAATADAKTRERLGGQIARIHELGCLACYKPDAFGEVVEAAKSNVPGALKALGDRWVAEAAK